MSLRVRIGSLAAIACLSLAHADAVRAHSVVVDPSGGGDFTTVQAALNSVAASFAPETVIVRAGAYAETVTLPQRDSQSLLVCPAGAESTSVAGMLLGPSTYSAGSTHRDWIVRGLSVGASVLSTPSTARTRFEQCAFAAGFTLNWLGGGVSMPVSECEFHGPTSLLGIYGIAQSLRFRDAPLRTEPRVGGLYYTNCSFVGAPGETLVVAPRTEDLGFTRCTFDSAGVGVWFPNGGFTGLSMDRCRFHRLALAVGEPSLDPISVLWTNRPLTVNDSRWDYCDRSLSWPGGVLTMARDTLRFCGEGAVQGTVESGDFQDLVVEDSFGTALDIRLRNSSHSVDPSADLVRSEFRRVAGTGARIRRYERSALAAISIIACRFEHCTTGAEIEGSWAYVRSSSFFANERDGLVVTPASTMGIHVSSNSFVANGRDGFALEPDRDGKSPLSVVHQNLAAHNGGAGIRIGFSPVYDFTRNDSWSNSGGDFVGATPDTGNFSLDPRFCDIASGDLTLSSDSPCASSDPSAFIGAEGIGCTLAPTGVTPGAGVTTFAVRPNPSRGTVEFALLPSTRAGLLEILDVQGRVVWSRAVGPQAHALSWGGETAHGRASPGLYWARLHGAGPVLTRTLIRLR